jgi:hypothetical protein
MKVSPVAVPASSRPSGGLGNGGTGLCPDHRQGYLQTGPDYPMI